MYINTKSINQSNNGGNVSLVCPNCGSLGTFTTISTDICVYDSTKTYLEKIIGHRQCQNPNCYGYVLVVLDHSKKLITSFPSIKIPINTSDVPVRIVDAFTEAINCFSNNCYVASAIMIRKTLEEICIDKNAEGKNLYLKIKDIGNKVVLPKELLEAMNELRLLGNDAAHIEAETYNQIGNEEIVISIEFTKEIIKAIYQYDSLLTKLKSLKKNN